MWKKKNNPEPNQLDEEKKIEEEKEEEIDESLAEIYEDDKGQVVDVKRFDVKKRRGPVFWSILAVVILAAIGGAVWAYKKYPAIFKPSGKNFELTIEPSKEKMAAGEEFITKITYKNMESAAAQNLAVHIVFPDNFKVLEVFPSSASQASTTNNLLFSIGDLGSKRSGEISIKGRLIAKEGDNSTIYAEATYTPANFSSEFKKTASADIGVNDIGYEFNFDNFTSAIVGEENQINVSLKRKDTSFVNGLVFDIAPKNNNFSVIPVKYENMNWLSTSSSFPLEWRIASMPANELQFPVKFKLTDKVADADQFIVKIYTEIDGKKYEIYQKPFDFEVIKGDLSLNLILNGSKNDQGVNLGDTLNYLLSYSNKSETTFNNVVIMAVIEGDAIDWTAIKDDNHGKVSGNTLSWSKDEIPGLATFAPAGEGTIEFSLKVRDRLDRSTSGEIKSYAKYSVSGAVEKNENVSNTIVSKINSELRFNEKVQYFNDDNIPVGSGPTPPKVGETTTYKVNWTVGGNIHELADTKVEMILPDGVGWAGKNYTNIGSVSYNDSERKVTWSIGRLPVIGEDISASFSIMITPQENDRDRIMVLSSGSKASALDSETNTTIENSSKAKTTKLEDDEIGGGDGVVR